MDMASETGETGEMGEEEGSDEIVEDDGGGVEEPPTEPPSLDGRPPKVRDVEDPRSESIVPPGTTDANRRAFLSLPVGVNDEAPLGGIGQDGTHIDRLAIGVEYANKKCRGKEDGFSVSAGEKVTLCIRVVQRRQANSVRVLWQKDGKVVRRSVITIKPTHAFRTRASLALREEYVGNWTARVVSTDGVELATMNFNVVP